MVRYFVIPVSTVPVAGRMVFVLFAAGLATYACTYLYLFCKKTEVSVKPHSRLQQFLSKRVPTAFRTYRSLYWCPEGRLQTILRNFIPFKKAVNYSREVLSSPDGGLFYLDWINNDDSGKYPDKKTRPTVFILPGLTSTSKSNYVLSMVDVLARRGYRVMVIVNRGLDGMELRTPKPFCATHTIDMGEVITMFKKRYPDAPLAVIGVSLGSLMVGRYLAMTGENSRLAGAVLHSCPFSPPHCTESLERWDNKLLFNFHLTNALKQLYSGFRHLFEHIVDHEEVMQSKTIQDYDRSFTAKVFGYDSVEHYYDDCVLTREKLHAIRVPTLCVSSDDDPFSPNDHLPRNHIAGSEHVALVVTRGGGHVSHLEKFNPFEQTYFERVMEEFMSGIFESQEL